MTEELINAVRDFISSNKTPLGEKKKKGALVLI